MKRRLAIGVIVIGLALLGSIIAIIAQEPYQHTVELELNWDPGHRIITATEQLTVEAQYITLEMRSRSGEVVTRQTRAVRDCQPVYSEEDLPTGICGSKVVFTVTLPSRDIYEEWVQGAFVLSNGKAYTYTVPGCPTLASDPDGFSLVGLAGLWYLDCPVAPPTSTRLPTATFYPIQSTYTAVPSPTCQDTATAPPVQQPNTPRPSPTPYPTASPWPTQPPT